ncbi:tRNA (guanine37-N1) -methyltransferase [Agrilactobacillus composti DSM 18527 = JCM 14202]|nr:tRNA (guanine37-N1) -methyltransferase [Agrilactobacillus composti DSM 18527 = JCM 14202]
MKISVLTLFPEMFTPLNTSLLGKAQEKAILEINLINFRDFAINKHQQVDDTPYGGGAGMLLMPQPFIGPWRLWVITPKDGSLS